MTPQNLTLPRRESSALELQVAPGRAHEDEKERLANPVAHPPEVLLLRGSPGHMIAPRNNRERGPDPESQLRCSPPPLPLR